ncbi:MAG: hypothetical protein AAGE38_09230 [Pseudomonadota bacterium]
MIRPMRTLAFAFAAVAFGAVAQAQQTIKIYTGGAPSGKGSAYHEGIGKGVQDVLEPIAKDFGYDVQLVPSNGSVDNANKLAAETGGIAFGIGQGGLNYAPVISGAVSILRNDLPGECAMAFSKEPQLSSWGEIVKNKERITWVVPENSGSEAFIKRMYREDANFTGAEPQFWFTSGAESILAAVNHPEKRGMVGFFYAYPNPTGGLINMAAKDDMRIFGVLSPDIAKTDEAYYLNRRAPYKLAWLGLGETQTTRAMCSKALLFVNDISKIEDTWAAEDAKAILEAMAAVPAEAMVAKSGPLAKLMRQVESMSEEYGLNEMVTDLEEQLTQ